MLSLFLPHLAKKFTLAGVLDCTALMGLKHAVTSSEFITGGRQ